MLTITIADISALEALERLRLAAVDTAPVMRDISEYMLEEVRENFDKQGRPDHWVDLDAATKAARARRNKWPGKILQESGTLKNTIFPSADSNSASVTAPAEYAAMQNLGSDGPVSVPQHRRLISTAFGKKLKYPVWVTVRSYSFDPNIPAREFMVLPETAQEEIQDLIFGHLETAFKGN